MLSPSIRVTEVYLRSLNMEDAISKAVDSPSLQTLYINQLENIRRMADKQLYK